MKLKTIASLFLALVTPFINASEDNLFWWHNPHRGNFGDELSPVIVEKILGRPVKFCTLNKAGSKKILISAGSILHYARDGDVIWGSGFRENPLSENRFHTVDVRSVRGPRTREFLLKMGIPCPTVYGDPAVLLGHLYPELKENEKIYEYIIIPNIGESEYFKSYKNVVLPIEPWKEIVKKMTQSKLVISSSLHGIIVAESYGIPARLLKMSWVEPLLKYQDYYESTNREEFSFATSVQEALKMGGERPGTIDKQALLDAFPWDYFE